MPNWATFTTAATVAPSARGGCPLEVCDCHIGYVHLETLPLYDVFAGGVLERIPAGLSRAPVRPSRTPAGPTRTAVPDGLVPPVPPRHVLPVITP
ncbi:hypothetical protein QFZ58_001159 [Streptomyces sp. B1I3]|nr:hypothetical protein [Streptomyces sp. B1I3]